MFVVAWEVGGLGGRKVLAKQRSAEHGQFYVGYEPRFINEQFSVVSNIRKYFALKQPKA